MFIVAMAMISGGYVLLYWGIDNFVSWISNSENSDGASSLSLGTNAPEIPILLGFKIKHPQMRNKDPREVAHQVPFPFHPVLTSGKDRPVSSTQPSAGGTIQV